MPGGGPVTVPNGEVVVRSFPPDSEVRFYINFESVGLDWNLQKEPPPLINDGGVEDGLLLLER